MDILLKGGILIDAAGTLSVVRTTDEDGVVSLTFTDKLGRTVLTRQVDGTSTYSDTYYVYDFGARLYDPALGRWISQDPMAEKYYLHSPYLFCAGNPMRFVDPSGNDIYRFDFSGNYLGKENKRGHHKIAVESYDEDGNLSINYFRFADPKNDPKAIDAGEITNLAFVNESTIFDFLDSQGTFDSDVDASVFIGASNSLSTDSSHNFDYSSSVLSSLYGGYLNNKEIQSKYLFIPQGDTVAHSLMNFGNFLWGASGYTIGLPISILEMGAQANSLGFFSNNNRSYNGYRPQFDSLDDQKSIFAGARYAFKNNYRSKRK
ncbi:MAG: RHS repeat-associated core domain-containing protein [Bacteroidales bacterium]|nr:RHS repeat-associated core domain-containing protein [Bacteroidales bacterium]